MKERADLLLVKQGLSLSREKAKTLIMAGQVYQGAKRVEKAGEMLDADQVLQLKGRAMPYVGRGGLKLEKALAQFSICLEGKTVLDIGASTGGFTDCALQNGAAKVYAVDVGYGQLDWKLRQDPRVIVREKTNARYLALETLGEQADFVAVDVSFISLDKIIPILPALMKKQGSGVALIKPQFEAGREQVGKKGVVRDPLIHNRVLEKINGAIRANGFSAYGLTYSPIKGPEGNIEYLIWFGLEPEGRGCPGGAALPDYLRLIVEEAFMALSKPSNGM